MLNLQYSESKEKYYSLHKEVKLILYLSVHYQDGLKQLCMLMATYFLV